MHLSDKISKLDQPVLTFDQDKRQLERKAMLGAILLAAGCMLYQQTNPGAERSNFETLQRNPLDEAEAKTYSFEGKGALRFELVDGDGEVSARVVVRHQAGVYSFGTSKHRANFRSVISEEGDLEASSKTGTWKIVVGNPMDPLTPG